MAFPLSKVVRGQRAAKLTANTETDFYGPVIAFAMSLCLPEGHSAEEIAEAVANIYREVQETSENLFGDGEQ